MPIIYQKYLNNDLTERKLFYTEDVVPTENDEELTYESDVQPTITSFIYGTKDELHINNSINKIPVESDANLVIKSGDTIILGTQVESDSTDNDFIAAE